MAKRRKYNDQFRAMAVLELITAGYPNTEGALAKVAAHLDLAPITLSRWARGVSNPPPTKVVIEKAADLTDIVETIFHGFAHEILERIAEGSLSDESLAPILTGFGIAFDKLRLLNGQSTGNLDINIKNASDSLDAKLDQIAQSVRSGELYQQPN